MKFAYFRKRKSGVEDRIRNIVEYSERQKGNKVKQLWSDNDGEYVYQVSLTYNRKQGIVFENTEP